MSENEPRYCDCRMLKEWAADPSFPVKFDEEMNEYHLMHGRASSLMRYCYWCGGRLPESKRGSFFTTPDDTEMAEVRELLKGARTLEDVFRILGPPDETVQLGGGRGDSILGKGYSFSQHYRYSRRWKTLLLKVHEAPGNRYGCFIVGHPIRSLRNSHDGDGADGANTPPAT